MLSQIAVMELAIQANCDGGVVCVRGAELHRVDRRGGCAAANKRHGKRQYESCGMVTTCCSSEL